MMLDGCTDAMHTCNAVVPCDASMHVRTYERTNELTPPQDTRDDLALGNAHERNGIVYIVHWPEAQFTKVGCSIDGRRWRPFLRRGGVLLGTAQPHDRHYTILEWQMHVDLGVQRVPRRFATNAEAKPYLGGSGRGFSECYVDNTGRDVIDALVEIEKRKPRRWSVQP